MRRFLTKLTLAIGLVATPVYAGDPTSSSTDSSPDIVRDSRSPAVPVETWVYATTDQKMEKGTFLGASTSAVSGELREHLGLQKGFGLLVDSLDKNGPAEKAGLKQYDILQKLDDQRLVNSLQLQVLIRSYKPNDKIAMAFLRKGQPMTVNVTLIESDVPELSDRQIESQQWGSNWSWGPSALKLASDTKEFNKAINQFDGTINQFDAIMNARNGANFVFKTQDRIFELGEKDGSKHLVVKDKDGKIIFEGPIDTEEQRSKLPPGVDAKLKQMQLKFFSTGGGGGSSSSASMSTSSPNK